MSRAFNNAEFIDSTEMDSNLPRTFSTIVNNDDILQMKQYAIDNLSRMSDKLSMLKQILNINERRLITLQSNFL